MSSPTSNHTGRHPTRDTSMFLHSHDTSQEAPVPAQQLLSFCEFCRTLGFLQEGRAFSKMHLQFKATRSCRRGPKDGIPHKTDTGQTANSPPRSQRRPLHGELRPELAEGLTLKAANTVHDLNGTTPDKSPKHPSSQSTRTPGPLGSHRKEDAENICSSHGDLRCGSSGLTCAPARGRASAGRKAPG